MKREHLPLKARPGLTALTRGVIPIALFTKAEPHSLLAKLDHLDEAPAELVRQE